MTREQQRELIADIITATPPPYKTLKWWIAPDPEDIGEQAWMLTLFLENFAKHNSTQQSNIVEWVNVTLTKINSSGIPCGVQRVRD